REVLGDLYKDTRRVNLDHPAAHPAPAPIGDHDHFTGADPAYDCGVPSFSPVEHDAGANFWKRIRQAIQQKEGVRHARPLSLMARSARSGSRSEVRLLRRRLGTKSVSPRFSSARRR